MAYASNQTVQELYDLIDSGHEPSFDEIKQLYYSNKGKREGNRLDTATQEKLTRLLIYRVRRKFKRDEYPRFFYEVDGKYKLLATSSDGIKITEKLIKLTSGFQKASSDVINDTAYKYPQLTSKFLYKLQASFEQIGILAQVAIKALEEGLKEQNEVETKQN